MIEVETFIALSEGRQYSDHAQNTQSVTPVKMSKSDTDFVLDLDRATSDASQGNHVCPNRTE